MGTQQHQFDVIYDTGSDWLIVEGSGCENCPGNTYNPATSSMSRLVGDGTSSRAYGEQTFFGTEYLDKVCINNLQGCVDSFKYFLISGNQTGLAEPFDGILGLARNKPFLMGINNATTSAGPLFAEALKDANVISDARFSFSLGYKNTSMFVDFGVPQTSAMSN